MNKKEFDPGIHYGIPSEDYHGSKALSNSMLSDLKDSPAHCFALHFDPNRPERVPTAAMRLGTLTHMAALEPDLFRTKCTVKPEGLNLNSSEGKAWKSAMVGMEIITADELLMIEAQRRAIQSDAKLAEMLAFGKPEVSAFWSDKATGLLCKCRPDWLQFTGPNRVRVFDLKTTADVTLDAVSKSVWSFGYHRQQAHYTRGLEACGLVVEEFVFGFVTKTYPFFAIPYVLDDETVAQGFEEVDELISLFSNCQRSGNWPLTGGGVQVVGLPGWARRETEIEVTYAS